MKAKLLVASLAFVALSSLTYTQAQTTSTGCCKAQTECCKQAKDSTCSKQAKTTETTKKADTSKKAAKTTAPKAK